MTVKQLHKLSKQCGSKIVEFKNGKINGYSITEYKDYAPVSVTLDKTIDRPDRALSFDGAYDLLYGNPTEVTPEVCKDNHLVCSMFNNGLQGCVLYKVAK